MKPTPESVEKARALCRPCPFHDLLETHHRGCDRCDLIVRLALALDAERAAGYAEGYRVGHADGANGEGTHDKTW